MITQELIDKLDGIWFPNNPPLTLLYIFVFVAIVYFIQQEIIMIRRYKQYGNLKNTVFETGKIHSLGHFFALNLFSIFIANVFAFMFVVGGYLAICYFILLILLMILKIKYILIIISWILMTLIIIYLLYKLKSFLYYKYIDPVNKSKKKIRRKK